MSHSRSGFSCCDCESIENGLPATRPARLLGGSVYVVVVVVVAVEDSEEEEATKKAEKMFALKIIASVAASALLFCSTHARR